MSGTKAKTTSPTGKWAPGRLIVGTAGIVMIGIGLRGIGNHSVDTHPRSWLIWITASALGDDLVVIPVLVVVGAVVVRVVPAAFLAVVQAALIISGAVTAVGVVAILASNRRAHAANPSLLPLPYARNLLIVLAAVWLIAAIAIVAIYVRRRERVEIRTERAE